MGKQNFYFIFITTLTKRDWWLRKMFTTETKQNFLLTKYGWRNRKISSLLRVRSYNLHTSYRNDSTIEKRLPRVTGQTNFFYKLRRLNTSKSFFIFIFIFTLFYERATTLTATMMIYFQ